MYMSEANFTHSSSVVAAGHLQRYPVRRSDSTSSFLESKRRDSESKLAQVYEQSEFLPRAVSLVAAAWPLHDIVITNIVSCKAQEKKYAVQK